jgi:peptide/nickel transport system ATP-binding protein
MMISFRDVNFSYTSKQSTLRNINIDILPGHDLGIVGESGSGKSTIMKLALGLHIPQSGSIRFDGQMLDFKDKEFKRSYRKSVQAVFQDPYSSLDPKQKVESIVGEPLVSLGISRGESRDWLRDQVIQVLASVGLFEDSLNKCPHEFSGGQRQRIAIARAIISRPQFLLADEPVSSLDVTNRELILELLKKLRREYGLTIAVISHDLSVIASLCQEIVVVERGVIVESGATARVLSAPEHAYTKKLLRSVPRLPHGTS